MIVLGGGRGRGPGRPGCSGRLGGGRGSGSFSGSDGGGGRGSGSGGDLLFSLYGQLIELPLDLSQGRVCVQRRRLGDNPSPVRGVLGLRRSCQGSRLGRQFGGQPPADHVQLVHRRIEGMNDDVRVHRRALRVIHARVEDGANPRVKPVAGHVGLDRRGLCAKTRSHKLAPGRFQLDLGLGELRLVLLHEDRLLVILLGRDRHLVLVGRDLLGERLGTGLERIDL